MNKYIFKARDQRGQVITGTVEAPTDEQAARLVRQKGLIVISISTQGKNPLSYLTGMATRVGAGQIATFTRQLATMINAGLPITEALQILRVQTIGTLQSVVSNVVADVQEGESLSSSLSKHPQVFSKTYIALIKSGETGGVLDEVLVRLADNLEKQQEFKSRVKSAMIYPIIVVIGMIAVAFIMLVFVVPRLTTLYDQFNADLPISTIIMVGVSNFMAKFWYLILLAVAGGVWGLKVYRATPEGRKKLDELILKVPLVGDLQRQIILTELTRTMSLMVGSGVSILDGLNLSSEVVGNKIMSNALADISSLVEKGFPVSYAFTKHPEAFPFILSQMISVGEETGKMDEVLAKVSHVFEVESEQKLKALTAAIEPIILIVLGVGVFFLVISIVLPIYNLTTKI